MNSRRDEGLQRKRIRRHVDESYEAREAALTHGQASLQFAATLFIPLQGDRDRLKQLTYVQGSSNMVPVAAHKFWSLCQ